MNLPLGIDASGDTAMLFFRKNVLCLEPLVSSGIDRYHIFWVSLGLVIYWVKSCDRPPLDCWCSYLALSLVPLEPATTSDFPLAQLTLERFVVLPEIIRVTARGP